MKLERIENILAAVQGDTGGKEMDNVAIGTVASWFNNYELFYLSESLSLYQHCMYHVYALRKDGYVYDERDIQPIYQADYDRYFSNKQAIEEFESLCDAFVDLRSFADIHDKILYAKYRESGDEISAQQIYERLLQPGKYKTLLSEGEEIAASYWRADFIIYRAAQTDIIKQRNAEITQILETIELRKTEYKALPLLKRTFMRVEDEIKFNLCVGNLFSSSKTCGKDFIRIATQFDKKEIAIIRSALAYYRVIMKRRDEDFSSLGASIYFPLVSKFDDAIKFLELEELAQCDKQISDIEQAKIICLYKEFTEYRNSKLLSEQKSKKSANVIHGVNERILRKLAISQMNKLAPNS